MAQAQAFETDFWKDANLRKVWDQIVPGEPRKTIPYTLTKEAIELTASRSAKPIRSISTRLMRRPRAMAD
jgi:hypothetical protein